MIIPSARCLRTFATVALIFLVSSIGPNTIAFAQDSAAEEPASTNGKQPAGQNAEGQTPKAVAEKPKAQKPAAETVSIVKTDEVQKRLQELKSQLADAAKRFRSNKLDDDDYVGLEEAILKINNAAEAISLQFQPRVQSIEQRLAELKPVGDSAVQSESAKLEEESQRTVLALLGGVMQQAQVIAIQAADLSISITQRRRVRFSERLFQRENSTLDPAFWSDVTRAAPRFLWRANLWAKSWNKQANLQIDRSLAVIFAVALLATIFLIVRSRGYVLKRIARDPDKEPRQTRRVIAALFVMMINLASAAIGSVLLYLFLDGTGSIPDPFNKLTIACLVAFTLFAIIAGLSRALFAPGRTNWRLIPIKASASNRAATIAYIGGCIAGLAVASEAVSQILDIPLPITVAVRALLTTCVAVLCLIGLRALNQRETDLDDPAVGEPRSNLWRLAVPFAWLASLVALFAPIFGFVALGWFLALQLILTATVCGLVSLFLAAIEELTTTGFQAGHPPGKLLTGILGFTPQGAEQMGVLAGGIAKLSLIVFAVMGVLVTWGLTSTDITRLEGMVTQFRIGDVTISITTIFSAIAIFVIGFMVTRAVQRWLENRYLPKTKLDVGLKTSIRTGIGYIGIVVAAMFAFSHLGMRLENLALVAGALSVGIGFGLQSIVSNFVSGLILLAERPIRTGDWVVVDGEHGTVRKINVRSTEIETFDRATMIVPNSNLISGVVKNWVLNDDTGRIIIAVGVDYDSDPDEVRQVLLDCVRSNSYVLAYPEPAVYFMNFGDSALEFEVRCYLSDIGMGLSVRSDLRFEIARRFKAAGIEMPFPQRTISFRAPSDAPAFEDAIKSPAKQKSTNPPVPRDAEETEDPGEH